MTADETARPGPPDWLPHRYERQRDMFRVVSVDRATRARLPFLSADALAEFPQSIVPRSSLRPAKAVPMHFIFHSAYCGSTLLSNFLDLQGASLSVKEPQVLNDLVGYRRRGIPDRLLREVMADAVAALGRLCADGEALVIKPSNVCNEFIDPLLQLRPDARCLLLFSPLRGYLTSIARKGLWGRRWARELLVRQLERGLPDFGFSAEDHLQQTDLEAAAVGWLAQMVQFVALAKAMPERTLLMSGEQLVNNPVQIARLACSHFGIDFNITDLPGHVDECLSLNAKDGSQFDARARDLEIETLGQTRGEEIEMIATWAEHVARNANLPIAL